MPGSTTMVLADGERLARQILARACAHRGIVVVGETASTSGLASLCATLRPDVVVAGDRLDEACPDEGVFDQVLSLGPRVLILTADPSPQRLTALLALGVHGYLSHDASPDEVASGVLAVARGAAAINPTAAGILLHQWRRMRSQTDGSSRGGRALTPREHQVLDAMAEGLATKAIARRLGVALKTVENHKLRIFEKLAVRSHAQAVSVAIARGLVGRQPARQAPPRLIEANADPIRSPSG